MQSVSFCHRLSKKLNFIKIWQLKVGQNKDLVCYRKKLSLRKCAWGPRQLVLKPGFKLKGGLWVCRKSQKISTASDQYFLSYVKKNYKGGGSNSGKNDLFSWICFFFAMKLPLLRKTRPPHSRRCHRHEGGYRSVYRSIYYTFYHTLN